MGLESVLLITDNLDDNLAAGFAQPAERAGARAQQTDPVSLVRFPKVLFTKGAVAKIEEMLA
jgi:large subunit ribosomal protein L4